ncbi:fused MFS/spermidine synthase [Synoicihabitans lomoniglobus]|uniref:Fused MFS/spermidine synthase n=1 Tax=Synoicihabitans lomoniglobus TaxID=2909285 RepID=A0AAF0I5T2_9BACT|nr:fused MFS/spermidine synthase [Opitutaceae bacterium LMO-M01]WED67454.1 fused MFS/spermidine synthase [Opitutaceae bacterium LMO-M01]
MLPFAVAIFLGAFLLFLVQPIMGRYLLPEFGGSPSVWTTCLLFFQTALLVGYAYAHVLTKYLAARHQVAVHLGLLMGAFLWLPPMPDAIDPGDASTSPIGQVLRLLITHVGLPFVLLAATGPLVQRWFSDTFPHRSPYRLYALSNVGSLLALVAYPFVIETTLTRAHQAWGWAIGFVGFTVVCFWCGRTRRATGGVAEVAPVAEATPPPTIRQMAHWLVWAGLATGLLAATTETLTLDIAAVPFLWLAPITVYLLTFVVTFGRAHGYRPVLLAGAMLVAAAVSLDLRVFGTRASFGQLLGGHLTALAVAGLICHGELFRSRPQPRYLTLFYLTISAGGALGTLIVAVLSPYWFDHNIDLPLLWSALILCVGREILRTRDRQRAVAWGIGQLLALAMVPLLRTGAFDHLGQHVLTWFVAQRWKLGLVVVVIIFAVGDHRHGWVRTWQRRTSWGVAVLGLWLIFHYLGSALQPAPDTVAVRRGFHGTVTVTDYPTTDPRAHARFMAHGNTTHGIQLTHADFVDYPTSYYHPDSGIGRALSRSNQNVGRNICVVGLGVGTIASYGMPGDRIRFYEIDPHVVELAERHFQFLARSQAEIEIVVGDGRQLIERENRARSSPRFDILVLDAFSSDAVPMHLLTTEAFESYLDRLAPAGVLVFNISNRLVDLRPVLEGHARAHDMFLAHIIHYPASDDWWDFASQWIILARERGTLDVDAITRATGIASPETLHGPRWTDDFASLWSVLR